MKFIKFLFKKLNFLVIILAYLLYFILFLCKIDVTYGSVAFAVTHIVVITTLLYSIFRLIFPIEKPTKLAASTVKTATKIEKGKSQLSVDGSDGKLYRVKQNPNYYFKEFGDRYELYLKTPSGYEYVKTDYKKDVNNG